MGFLVLAGYESRAFGGMRKSMRFPAMPKKQTFSIFELNPKKQTHTPAHARTRTRTLIHRPQGPWRVWMRVGGWRVGCESRRRNRGRTHKNWGGFFFPLLLPFAFVLATWLVRHKNA